MCGLDPAEVELGIDGCSAPNFAVPLRNAALGMARLCDPRDLAPERAAACRKITSAMTATRKWSAGFGEFDCELMKACEGRVVTKRGAEGFQIIGLLPGVLAPDSPGMGIAFKVTDGDASRMSMDLRAATRVRPAVTLEILRQLGVLTAAQLEKLAAFGPGKQISEPSRHRYRTIEAGLYPGNAWISPGRQREIHKALLRAYGEPTWREALSPLDELVSTILSQNTNDLNRDRAFGLRARFPHVGGGARRTAGGGDRSHPPRGPGQPERPAHPAGAACHHGASADRWTSPS